MKRSILATHSTIRNTLFALLLFVIVFFVFLKNGISIDHLKIASFSVDGLYLKLDKKFILKAESLTIPASKKKQPLPNLEKGLDRFNEILRYFEYIELKEINFKNDRYSILYSDHIFYMVNDLFEIATHHISRQGDEVHAIIDLVYLKQYDIRFSGKLVYNYKRDTALVRGKAAYRDIHADFMLNKRRKNLYFTAKSDTFTQLKPLLDQFKLPPVVSEWVTERVKAKSYRLQSFKAVAKIDKNGSIKIIPDLIAGKALLRDASVEFKKGLTPAFAEKIAVVFKEGNLYFELIDPSFKKRPLKGSVVSIVNFLNPKPITLRLNLKFKSRIDAEVLKIVKAYGIMLPLMQKSGITDSVIKLDINLKAKKVQWLSDFKLEAGEIAIGRALLPVTGGEVHIEKGIVSLSGIQLKNSNYQLVVNGTINLSKKLARLKLAVHSLRIGEKEKPFLLMKKTKISMNIDYRNSIKIVLPTLKTRLEISKKDGSGVIKIADLSLIKKYIKNLPVTINGGHLTISSKNFKQYQFEGLVKRNDCFIYESESSCMTQVPIRGTFSGDGFVLKAFQDRFVFDAEKSLITLRHLNLDLKKFFDDLESKSTGRMNGKMRVLATDSVLRYSKSKLVTDHYELEILPGGNFYFLGKLGEDTVRVRKRGKKVDILANRITDRMLHPLINFGGLQKGHYSVKITGEPGKLIVGEITLDGGVMSNFKAYNNMLAFINTIPALATLHSPGFSRKGFVIKEGKINFAVSRGELITFKSVLIKGKSATISGEGTVDLKTQKINVDLAIQTAKVMGNIIGSLPVVGYILTGENKSIMTVGLHIGGTLEKPISKTSPIKDVLLLPFKMIGRTLSIPGHLKKKNKREEEDDLTHF